MFSFFGGGHGGHSAGDGLSHGNAPISTATIPPLEILEAAYPVRFTQWALRPDSAGDGRHRGGLGAIYEINCWKTAPRPSSSASAAAAAPGRGRRRAGGIERVPLSAGRAVAGAAHDLKMLGIALKRGERVRLETPGGGGYGPPAQRSEAARRRDRDMGYVSGADAARKRKGMTMATTQQSLVVGVDVGGTFTDLFVLDEHTGERA